MGINSDIGTHLGNRFIRDGYSVIGTFRNKQSSVKCPQVYADFSYRDVSKDMLFYLEKHKAKWKTMIFCVGDPLPLQKFMDCETNRWIESLTINSVNQLVFLKDLYKLREDNAAVCFLSAGGVNSCPEEFSAYTLGKTLLVKASELIAAEYPELKVFTYGPGWVPTKTHDLMLKNTSNEERKDRILKYVHLNLDLNRVMDDIYKEINTLLVSNHVSGKNFARGNVKSRLSGEKHYPNSGKLRITI